MKAGNVCSVMTAKEEITMSTRRRGALPQSRGHRLSRKRIIVRGERLNENDARDPSK